MTLLLGLVGVVLEIVQLLSWLAAMIWLEILIMRAKPLPVRCKGQLPAGARSGERSGEAVLSRGRLHQQPGVIGCTQSEMRLLTDLILYCCLALDHA